MLPKVLNSIGRISNIHSNSIQWHVRINFAEFYAYQTSASFSSWHNRLLNQTDEFKKLYTNSTGRCMDMHFTFSRFLLQNAFVWVKIYRTKSFAQIYVGQLTFSVFLITLQLHLNTWEVSFLVQYKSNFCEKSYRLHSIYFVLYEAVYWTAKFDTLDKKVDGLLISLIQEEAFNSTHTKSTVFQLYNSDFCIH